MRELVLAPGPRGKWSIRQSVVAMKRYWTLLERRNWYGLTIPRNDRIFHRASQPSH